MLKDSQVTRTFLIFFDNPDAEAVLEAPPIMLPSCVTPEQPSKFPEPVACGEFVKSRLAPFRDHYEVPEGAEPIQEVIEQPATAEAALQAKTFKIGRAHV